MVTTIQNFNASNEATGKVMNYLAGHRTYKQVVGEYFGLREEAIYDDNGDNIIDFVSDFKDIKALEQKKVQYNDKLAKMGVTEEQFISLFPNGLPFNTKKDEGTNEGTIEGTESNTGKSGKIKKK